MLARDMESAMGAPANANEDSGELVARYGPAGAAAATEHVMSLIRSILCAIVQKDTQEIFARICRATGIWSSKSQNLDATRISCHSAVCAGPKATVFATPTTQGYFARSLRASSATPWINARTDAMKTECVRAASAFAMLVSMAKIVV